MANCPKCGFEHRPGAGDCDRCGLVFSKYESHRVEQTEELFQSAERMPRSMAAAPVVRTSGFLPQRFALSQDEDEISDGTFGTAEKGILAFGFIAALLFVSVPFLSMVIWPIKTLFHELGHAVTGWLLGHPSVPAFDFTFGGGMTHYGEFQPLLALAIAGVFLWLGWQLRGNRLSLAVISALGILWLFVVTSAWRREIVMASAGVLFELIMAATFLYMAIAGIGFRNAALERPLAAFVAFIVQMFTMRFLWLLRTSEESLATYKEGKGGALMNDLEVIALDLHIHTPFNPGIERLAGMLLLFSLVPMTIAVLWFLQRRRGHHFLHRLRLLRD